MILTFNNGKKLPGREMWSEIKILNRGNRSKNAHK